MAAKINLPKIEAGSMYRYAFYWSQKDQDGIITPVDLTGFSARLQIKRVLSDDVPLAEWGTSDNDTDGEITIGGTDNNKIQLEVPSSKTASLSFEDAIYDLLVWPTGNTEQAIRLAYGTVSAEENVTGLP